ncbi:proliferating cell nuclear antigen [Faustovirus]|nr:proliferating cell nuclear antigen [Faustovirus]QJX73538.1 proliferating cell nuclear antigen [Faustovirus]
MESIKTAHRDAKRRHASSQDTLHNNKRFKINTGVARKLFVDTDDATVLQSNPLADSDDQNGLHQG